MKEKLITTGRRVGIALTLYFLNAQVAFAANGTEKIDEIANDFLRPWLVRIGMVLALFGGANLVLSVMQDNPEAKSRGVQFLSGGLMLAFGVPFFMSLIGF